MPQPVIAGVFDAGDARARHPCCVIWET
jgi:hypothetical protein